MELNINSFKASYPENYQVQKNIKPIDNQIKNDTEERISNYQQQFISGQEQAIIKAIEKSNIKFEDNTKELKFSIHEKTKQIIVKIIDKSSKEVIKEIPSEKILDMISSMCELAGIFVDKKR